MYGYLDRSASPAELEQAEAGLADEVPTWRTDELEQALAPRVLSPTSDVPPGSREPVNALWWCLGMHEATELVQHLARRELANRRREYGAGPCPACHAPGARYTVYDGGRYVRATHPNPDAATDTEAWGYRPQLLTCYVGPAPLPAIYEG